MWTLRTWSGSPDLPCRHIVAASAFTLLVKGIERTSVRKPTLQAKGLLHKPLSGFLGDEYGSLLPVVVIAAIADGLGNELILCELHEFVG